MTDHAHDHAHGHDAKHGGCCSGKPKAPAGEHGMAKDPVCGMNVDPHNAKHPRRAWRAHLLLLRRRLPHQVHRRSRQVPEQGRAAGRARARGRDLHLPDASADPADRPRLVPHLRHGARARADHRRRAWPAPRTRRHAAPLLDRPGAGAAGFRSRDGQPSVRLASPISPDRSRTGCSCCWRHRSCCGPAGRSSSAAGNRCVTRNLNMFTLIAMGTGVAWTYSVVATLAPGIFPAAFRGHDGSVAVYFEAAAVITVLVLLGQVLELRAREQTSRRHSRAARPRAEDGAPRRRRRGGRGCAARRRRCRRPAARAPGRKGPRRRQF